MAKIKTYVALFRGINVGKKNRLNMELLRNRLQSSPFTQPQTYIQSGNLIFKSLKTNCEILSMELEKLLLASFKLNISIIVLTVKEFEEIVLKNPFSNTEISKTPKVYISFIKGTITPETIETFAQNTISNDKFHLTKKVIYTCYKESYSLSKLTNNLYEKKLNCTATTRNWKTTHKVLEMAKNSELFSPEHPLDNLY